MAPSWSADEDKYIGHGEHFCPHCDGPFYKGKDVAVIGGGNSGIEAAIDLAGICRHVTVLEFADAMRADEVLQQKVASLLMLRCSFLPRQQLSWVMVRSYRVSE